MNFSSVSTLPDAVESDLGADRLGHVGTELIASRPHVAVVEDNLFTLEAWIDRLTPDAVVFPFESPEALQEHMASDPSFLGTLACVITDFYFDNSEQDGIAVGRAIKAAQPSVPVFLSSDGYFETGASIGFIDRVIVKNPVAFHALPISNG